MKIKSFLKKNKLVVLILNYKRILKQKISINRYNDEEFIIKGYKKKLGREINLENPVRFTEKLQWLKMNYRNPLMNSIVDKIAFREYLTKMGYSDYLMPIIGYYRSVNEIDFDKLPYKCILKASHGSSMHLIKEGKIKHIWLWKAIMNSWLKMNIYIDGREWPYKDVPPGIICEEFVEPQFSSLTDYKVYCFDSNPKYIQVDSSLLSNHQIDFFDIEWNHLNLKRSIFPNAKTIPQKPHNYEKIIEIASALSKPFPHARVDFIEYDNILKIGEITFFDFCGFAKFEPDEYDYVFGEQLNLREYKECV